MRHRSRARAPDLPQLGGPVITITAFGAPARSVARLCSSAWRLKKAPSDTPPSPPSSASPALAASAPPRGAGCSAFTEHDARVRPGRAGKNSDRVSNVTRDTRVERVARRTAARTVTAAVKRVLCCALRGHAAQMRSARLAEYVGAVACSCAARQPRGGAEACILRAAAQRPPWTGAGGLLRREYFCRDCPRSVPPLVAKTEKKGLGIPLATRTAARRSPSAYRVAHVCARGVLGASTAARHFSARQTDRGADGRRVP